MGVRLNSVLAALTGGALFLFGNDPKALHWLSILFLLMVVDFGLGLINSAIDGTFKARVLLEGIRRKVGEILLVMLACQAAKMGILTDTVNIQLAVTGGLVAYEFTSVLEKIKVGGVPIPQILLDFVKKMGGKSGGGDG